MAGVAEFDTLTDIIHARRTHMFVDATRVVPDETITALCELAMWAPSHKKTWPWRFAAFTGDGRARLGDAFVDDMIAADFGDDGKRSKTRTKYLRTPNTLVVATAPHDKPTIHDENRDAAAAGIQNILLGATALGLASFWSTPPIMSGSNALELCGLAPDDRIIGVIYLGYSNSEVRVPDRPDPPITHIR